MPLNVIFSTPWFFGLCISIYLHHKLCWLSLFHLPPTPIFLLSFYLLAIASVWWSQVSLLSLSLSSCCKHRLTIQLFFIFLFCLLQSSTAAATATAAHPSGWGSVATTTLKKINLHAASSARPRWQHCIKHTNTHVHTHTHARERGRENKRAQLLLFVCCNECALPLSLSLLLFAQVKLFPKMWMTVNSLSAAR